MTPDEYTRMMAGLADLIERCRLGDKGAVASLRAICRGAADKAPPIDLARMAQALYDIRAELNRRHVESQ